MADILRGSLIRYDNLFETSFPYSIARTDPGRIMGGRIMRIRIWPFFLDDSATHDSAKIGELRTQERGQVIRRAHLDLGRVFDFA